jgi:SAM-dependent methyltransferase
MTNPPHTGSPHGGSPNIAAWDRIAGKLSAEAGPADGVIRYGDDLATERDLRLLGTLEGKRVLELGCGTGHNAVALVHQGAKAIAIEPSEQLAACARRFAEIEQVRIEVRSGDLADLAFLRAETVDVAFSAGALGEVDDLDRVLRQVHRVLRPNGVFVCAMPHPFALCVARDATAGGGPLPLGRIELVRSYLDGGPVTVERMGESFTLYVRPLSAMFAAFTRAGFDVDHLLELAAETSADPGPALPTTVIWRARRLGL